MPEMTILEQVLAERNACRALLAETLNILASLEQTHQALFIRASRLKDALVKWIGFAVEFQRTRFENVMEWETDCPRIAQLLKDALDETLALYPKE